MMKSSDGLYINIHEAALINYPAMSLNVDATTFKMSSHLTPPTQLAIGYMQTDTQTPWRTIVVSDRALIFWPQNYLKLNEPTSYKIILEKPMKYIRIWWEHALGKVHQNKRDYVKLGPLPFTQMEDMVQRQHTKNILLC
jgi:hypothetical protein